MDRRRSFGIAAGVLLLLGLLLLLLLWPSPDDAPVPAPAPAPAPAPTPADAEPVADPSPDREAPPGPPEPPEPPPELPPDADAEELRARPDLHAVCQLEPPLARGTGHLVVGDPGAVPYNGRLVPIVDGEAFLVLLPPDGAGVLAVEGYAPVPISWSGSADGVPARCVPEPVRLEPGAAFVSGHVTNAEGEPEGQVFVEGCGNQARTDAEGSYALTVSPGPCVLQAFRRDGLLFSAAPAVELAPSSGDDLVVDFALPEVRKAGMGIVVETVEGGILVQRVLAGTSAEDHGLQADDLIVEVDGTPTAELTLEEFVDLAVGDEGTEVEVVAHRGDAELRMVLDRRVIDRPPEE